MLNPTVDLPLIHSGKVRDVYDAGDGRLLMVTSDRISAFDVVMDESIPDKGRVLTAMTAFWFERFADLVQGHLISTGTRDLAEVLGGAVPDDLVGRTMLCRRAEMLPIECIVRGYITGSAWKEYRTSGTMHGGSMPEGLLWTTHSSMIILVISTSASAPSCMIRLGMWWELRMTITLHMWILKWTERYLYPYLHIRTMPL